MKRSRALVLIVVAFLISVAVRAPHIGRPLSAHHEYCTALVLIFLYNWQGDGFAEHKGTPAFNFSNEADRYIHPPSYEFATRGGVLYYLSHAQLAYYLPYVIHRIIGKVPDATSLTWFDLCFHLVTTFLLYRVLKESLSDDLPAARRSIPYAASLFYLFMPAPLWFHANAYMADMFVQNVWVIHLLLAVRLFSSDPNQRPHLLALFYFSLSLVILTNWLGVFVGATSMVYALYRWRGTGMKEWGRVAILTLLTILISLALVISIYAAHLGLNDLMTYLWYRFQDRATMQFWEGGILFHLGRLLDGYLMGWLPLMLLIFLLLLLRLFRWRPLKTSRGFRIFLLLTLLPVLMDHAVFLKYSGHDFAALKAGFFLCGISAWLLTRLFDRELFWWAGSLAVCITGIMLFYYYNPIGDDASRHYARQQRWGSKIAEIASKEEVVFALGWAPEPQEQWYAKRTLKPVLSKEEAREFLRQRNFRSGVIFNPAGDSLRYERITAR